jgi:hypothetical protein
VPVAGLFYSRKESTKLSDPEPRVYIGEAARRAHDARATQKSKPTRLEG